MTDLMKKQVEENMKKFNELTKDMVLSKQEYKTLEWVSKWDEYTVDAVVGIIKSARKAGRKEAWMAAEKKEADENIDWLGYEL